MITQRHAAKQIETDRPAKVRVDRFGKSISRHFTTQGFPRLRLYREMQRGLSPRAAASSVIAEKTKI